MANIRYAFLILTISFLAIILFAPFIGFGDDESFFLFVDYGITRHKGFLTLFALSIILILPNISSLKKWEIPNSFYAFLVLILSSFYFFIYGKHTAFEWTTTQDIPTLLRLLDERFLLNDFYTNASMESPRLVFNHIVYFLTFLGLSWYSALYFLKVLMSISIPVLSYLAMVEVYRNWEPANFTRQHREVVKGVFFFFSFGLLIPLQGSDPGSLAGWGAIQDHGSITPMTLSFILGLIYTYASFAIKRHSSMFVSTLILLFCTWNHPVVGLFHFVILTIFYLPIKLDLHRYTKIFLDLLVGVTVPILFLISNYNPTTTLDPEIFVEFWVFVRHPHHYVMSEIFGLKTVFWLMLLIIPFFISYRLKNTRLVILTGLILTSFIAAPLLQYFGTEVLSIKKIAELGPTRYTAFLVFVWQIEAVIIVAYVVNSYKVQQQMPVSSKPSSQHIRIQGLISIFISAVNRSLNFFIPLINTKVFTKSCIIMFPVLTLFIWHSTLIHPLDFYWRENVREPITWIRENTKKTDVFFVYKFNSHLIRAFAERSVFVDASIPFNENYFEEYVKRYEIWRNPKILKPEDFSCLTRGYKIEYLIMHDEENEKYEEYEPIFISKNWVIYDVRSFEKDVSCSG